MSIRQTLANGDQVEINTSPNQHPTSDWLNYVASTKAKNKIKQALKEVEYKQAAEGRELLERRFKNWKLDCDEAHITKLALKLGYKAISDFYQALAQGKEDVQRLKEVYADLDTVHTVSPQRETTTTTSHTALALEVDIHVKNVDYALSKCCNPQPGDPIFGFVSVTKGIRIHHCDCPNALHMRERYPYRVIPARWKEKNPN